MKILRYLFENCVLDTDCRELRRGTNLVAIEPQVFDLLAYLVRHRDRVVSKDDLLASVWHGRAISESALFNRINAARSAIGDTGERQALIKTLPRRGLRFVGAVREEEFSPAIVGPDKSSPGFADKPSIAVLPFVNLSGDPEQDYFIDGIVEDIITALSRNRAFFVIARNSSFTYKGRAVDTKQVARELGVRYVLEGSVRKSGNRMRVTGQLIEAESGYHLWADRFEGDLVDIFDLQDQLVTSVVGAIAPQLEKAEIERAKRELTSNPAAYDFYLRGLANWNCWSRPDNEKALKLFYAAIEKDPEFATPYGLAASCYQFAKANGWQSDFDAEEISRLTERAAELGNDDAVALCWAGHVRAFFFKEVDRALLLISRALELDLNLAVAWQRSGWVRGYAGDSDGAIESLNKAMRLDPLDTRVFLTQSAMAFAHFVAGRDQEAAEWAGLALRTKPNWMPALRVAIASNAMHGRAAEAKAALQSYERIDPNLSIRKICEHYPFQREKDKRRLVKALRKAGVREA
ncbi:MAG TPA: winged helix-turn-helix domain-containing tetratricopeptide repeat protein [Xanthobacteraceae bacterium]|nr:winged helix-turn-helix domain-containing tetratricopeptide repeat protein [Xanthobacteraceae bacterium]